MVTTNQIQQEAGMEVVYDDDVGDGDIANPDMDGVGGDDVGCMLITTPN